MLVEMAVGAVALRFATRYLLQPDQLRRVRLVLMALVAATKYLVLNGFKALNVQLSHLRVKPVIVTSDLSLFVTEDASTINVNVTTSIATYSENVSRNPIANTILRNAILPQVMKPGQNSRKCNGVTSGYLPRVDIVNYGFPTRSWQREMLPVALDPRFQVVGCTCTDQCARHVSQSRQFGRGDLRTILQSVGLRTVTFARVCDSISNSSLLVVSIGKSMVADAIHEDRFVEGYPTINGGHGESVVMNLRKIYTLTVGRLAWQTANLSKNITQIAKQTVYVRAWTTSYRTAKH